MQKMSEKITISALINAPVNKTWDGYTAPQHITQWNFADPSWHCPHAENDVRVGGKYTARMEAKDGSFGFDFEGIYNNVELNKELSYHLGAALGEGREVTTLFETQGERTLVTTTFDPENENPVEMQKMGWQMILDNFKKYVESI
jgi:uncharacterized protein YndB with AHSA1/START domain